MNMRETVWLHLSGPIVSLSLPASRKGDESLLACLGSAPN